jgi:hypothetical protein
MAGWRRQMLQADFLSMNYGSSRTSQMLTELFLYFLCFLFAREEKNAKKERKKTAFQQEGWQLQVHNAWAFRAVMCYKKLIQWSLVVLYVHPMYW